MTPNTEIPSETIKITGAATERRNSGWDIRNAPKNYAALIAAHTATAFFSFASVWLITGRLGAEGYGAIVASVAASQLVQIFINWSSTALVRFGIEEFVETGRITRSFWSRTLIFLPNLLLALVLAAFWLTPVASWLKIPDAAVWLIAAHLFATSVWLHVQNALQAVKMLRLQGILLAAERMLTLLGLVLLIGSGELTLVNTLWCYILPSLLLTAVGFFVIRDYIALEGFFEREHFRKMLVFSLPLIPFAVVGYLSTSQLDAFFITRFLSTRELGVYAVASQINGLALQLPILANTILISMVVSLRAGGQDSVIQNFFKDAVPALTIAWSAACVALSGLCLVFIPLFFGREFEDATVVLWILTTATVCYFPVLMGFATLSNAYSKTYISMYASFGTASANVLFNLLLIPRFGMIGCGWATVLSSFTGLSIFYFLLLRCGLISHNWTLLSVAPATAGALAVSAGLNAPAAIVVFVLSAFFVAYFHWDSVKYAVRVVRGRLNAKDVPPEPSLR